MLVDYYFDFLKRLLGVKSGNLVGFFFRFDICWMFSFVVLVWFVLGWEGFCKENLGSFFWINLRFLEIELLM